uniref:Fibrinogen C-terminal domain-containing protein n=1 Tax=Anopheles dirus TaxID=7168 RepID=A0A182MYC6_9DIPT
MQVLASCSGVYSWSYPGNKFGFYVNREGLKSHGDDWFVFQRRIDGSVKFDRSWNEYEDGFGDLCDEHWLGLRKLYSMLQTGRHELLVEMETFFGEVIYAKYDDFKLRYDNENYKLTSLGSYTGNAKDSLTHRQSKVFATFDKNDVNNCARIFGGGWWFDNCYDAYVLTSTYILVIAVDNLNCISCYRHLNGRYRQRASGFGFEMLLARLDALESRLNERLELLSTSTTKLEDQLKETSDKLEKVTKSVSTLDERLKVFENTNTNAFTSLRSHITQLSNGLSTSVGSLKDSGREFSKHLEQRMQVLASCSGVYSWSYPGKKFGFYVHREGLKSHGYGGDWFVFQRRIDGSVEFNRSWTEYKDGFGDLCGEHWLGLKKLRNMLTTRRHELLVEMETFLGETLYAKYDDFQLGNESDGYKLKSLGNYSGNAKDSLTPHIGKVFVTFDKNDVHNCARLYGGGWWFDNCYHAHLNGRYQQKDDHYRMGVSWTEFNKNYSMKSTKMMVRLYS